ncbi:MAG: 50S ribosomal protein L35 [Candidatus Doudnabacteria bacterium]|nr:50S ribosomal protein L35 [Candidatus Doudnabacteria bacterium]
MKQKTNKRVAKTFWITGSGKLRQRKAGQDHFNSRESGKITKNKRRDSYVHKSNLRIKELIGSK